MTTKQQYKLAWECARMRRMWNSPYLMDKRAEELYIPFDQHRINGVKPDIALKAELNLIDRNAERNKTKRIRIPRSQRTRK